VSVRTRQKKRSKQHHSRTGTAPPGARHTYARSVRWRNKWLRAWVWALVFVFIFTAVAAISLVRPR
jgi:hypothetical protein